MITADEWAAKFGDDYTDRQMDMSGRGEFWNGLIDRHQITTVLEVGCGTGANIVEMKVPAWGMDVNRKALHKIPPKIKVAQGDARAIPFASKDFDMVLTFGVLIHIPDEDLENAMKEIVRCARRFVFCGEYQGNDEVPYRGGVLWRRNYNALYEEMGLEPIEKGTLTGEPWDKGTIHWGLFKIGDA